MAASPLVARPPVIASLVEVPCSLVIISRNPANRQALFREAPLGQFKINTEANSITPLNGADLRGTRVQGAQQSSRMDRHSLLVLATDSGRPLAPGSEWRLAAVGKSTWWLLASVDRVEPAPGSALDPRAA
jgi:hypothetical protein